MDNQINYYIKENYGTPTMYAADEEMSKKLRNLLGTKTITPDAKIALEAMGFVFTRVFEPSFHERKY